MSLREAERELQAAQRASDVVALDTLLHPRVVAVGPDGSVFGKEEDLASHRSGALRITRLVEESLHVEETAPTGITRTVAVVDAIHDGVSASVRLLYTRMWVREDGHWRVLAASFVPV